jgi:beta-galactosidase/beta-glucuronidase
MLVHGNLDLNGTWTLAFSEAAPEDLRHPAMWGRLQLPARVPAPIHEVLAEAGVLQDVNVGLNALAARWVEDEYWVYRRTFTAPDGIEGSRLWLTFAKLELEAIVYLNGEEVGRHTTAHRPARLEVTGKVVPGENLHLAVIGFEDDGLGILGEEAARGREYLESEAGHPVLYALLARDRTSSMLPAI